MALIMTQEQKDLLIKDLCARLPYGTMVYAQNDVDWYDSEICTQVLSDVINEDYIVKPYLFPMSSMSSNHIFEIKDILGEDFEIDERGITDLIRGRYSSLSYLELDALFEYFNKNHFDYRDLIPMGLALDATNLNVY